MTTVMSPRSSDLGVFLEFDEKKSMGLLVNKNKKASLIILDMKMENW